MSDTPSSFGSGGSEDQIPVVTPGSSATGSTGRAELADLEGEAIEGAEQREVADEATEAALAATVAGKTLVSLSDVAVSSPVTGQVLEWNGTHWVASSRSTVADQVVIVSSTAPAWQLAQAATTPNTYVCTGTNDEAVFNTATASINAFGGEVLVSAGQYYFTTTGWVLDQTGAVSVRAQTGATINVAASFTGHHAVQFAKTKMPNNRAYIENLSINMQPLQAVKVPTKLTAAIGGHLPGSVITLTVASTTGWAVGDVGVIGYRKQEWFLVQTVASSTTLTVQAGLFGQNSQLWTVGMPVSPMVTGLTVGCSSVTKRHCTITYAVGDGFFDTCFDWGVVGYLDASTPLSAESGGATTNIVVDMPVDGNGHVPTNCSQLFVANRQATIGSGSTYPTVERVSITAVTAGTADSNGNPTSFTLTITRPSTGYAWTTGSQVQMDIWGGSASSAGIGAIECYENDCLSVDANGNGHRVGTQLYQNTLLAPSVGNFEMHRSYVHGHSASSISLQGFYIVAAALKMVDCHPYFAGGDGGYWAAGATDIEVVGGEWETNGGTFYTALDGYGVYCDSVVEFRFSKAVFYNNAAGWIYMLNCLKWDIEGCMFHSVASTSTQPINLVNTGTAPLVAKGRLRALTIDVSSATSTLNSVINVSSPSLSALHSDIHIDGIKTINTPGSAKDITMTGNHIKVDNCSLASGIVEGSGCDYNLITESNCYDIVGSTIASSTSGGTAAVANMLLGAAIVSGTAITQVTIATTGLGAVTIPSGTTLYLVNGTTQLSVVTTASVTTSTTTSSTVAITSVTPTVSLAATSTTIGGWTDVWTLAAVPAQAVAVGAIFRFQSEKVIVTAINATTKVASVTRGYGGSGVVSATSGPAFTVQPRHVMTGSHSRARANDGLYTRGSGTLTFTGGAGASATFGHGLDVIPVSVRLQQTSGTPAANMVIGKSLSNFTVQLGADPGAGNNPTFDWWAEGYAA
jgi:hypothetical protein